MTPDGRSVERRGARWTRRSLHQIVWNLCDNAMQSRGATAGATAVEMRCGPLETAGPGPSSRSPTAAPASAPDNVERIFEPFFTGGPGGTGLGLFLARELAPDQRRHAAATSRAAAAAACSAWYSPIPNRWEYDDRTIRARPMTNRPYSIVDDEPDLLRARRASRSSAWSIDTRTAADVAQRAEAAEERPFDLCLTDMRLPDGDGLDLVELDPARYRRQLPVAVITAHGNVESAVRALKLGAFDFVSKPLDLGVLRKLVGSAIRLGSRRDGARHDHDAAARASSADSHADASSCAR